ncbi:MAG: ABC transporter, partial [Polaromonas sp.]
VWLDPRDTALDPQTARQIFNDFSARHTGFDAGALQAHIDGLSLAPHLDKALDMMSNGTRRKVLMAAALASGAAVTLLDQPFTALDRPSIDYLLQVLDQASRHTDRAWVVADYEAPVGVRLAGVIALGG